MPANPQKKFSEKGQALIGIVIAIGVFVILMHSLFTLVSSSYRLVSFNKARVTARHIAQEKVEIIRNLPYEDVGTGGGIPAGVIEPEEDIFRNDLNFLVETSIIYIDNSFDQLAPDDDFPTDYKRVRVEVSWGGIASSNLNPVILITDIAPSSSVSTNSGTLEILVINANGIPVPQAQVTITAPSLSPPVNTTLTSDDDGFVILPGAPLCDSCYEITVTKEGYTTDRTYSTGEVANPTKSHASSIQGQITSITFAIDIPSTINVASFDSRENEFATLGNVDFTLRGAKTIGTDTSGQPVYKFEQDFVTDSGGVLQISNLEWDSYQIFTAPTSSFDISGTNPLLPLPLAPDSEKSLTFSTEVKSSHSFLVSIRDTSLNIVEEAYVRVFEASTSYDEATTSGKLNDPDYGQAFYPDLQELTYSVEATASGYTNYSNTFNISGYTKEEILMSP